MYIVHMSRALKKRQCVTDRRITICTCRSHDRVLYAIYLLCVKLPVGYVFEHHIYKADRFFLHASYFQKTNSDYVIHFKVLHKMRDILAFNNSVKVLLQETFARPYVIGTLLYCSFILKNLLLTCIFVSFQGKAFLPFFLECDKHTCYAANDKQT